MYAVAEEWGQTEVMRIDRAAVAAFGIKAAGVHLNGFVGRGPKTRVWIAKRSLDKAVAPGKLDHLVAGGQPAGLGLMENLIKECAEEANIPENLALQSAPVGMVSYQMDYAQGLRHDRLFCYDLELPVDFIPHPADGEVESFMLWPIEQVMETVLKTRDFKFNVALVLIDFLVRHGHITPDGEPDYLEIVKGLRGA
jgi:hypothetical protein